MVRFTDAERVEVWDRWQAGDANRLIGRDLRRSAASNQGVCRIVGWGSSSGPATSRTALIVDRAGGYLSWCRCE